MILNNKNAPFESYKITLVDTKENKVCYQILKLDNSISSYKSFAQINRADFDFYELSKTENLELKGYEALQQITGFEIEEDSQNWANVSTSKIHRTIISDTVISDANLKLNNSKLLIDAIVQESKEPIEKDPPVIIRNDIELESYVYTETLPVENIAILQADGYLEKIIHEDGTIEEFSGKGVIIEYKLV